MLELLKDLIVAIGGGTVVLVGILTIFKNLLIKIFETGIGTAFEKNLEKYRNQLSRSTKAFDILLDREMRFYERMEPIIAELVPLEQDLLYSLKGNDEMDQGYMCEAFRTHFSRYTELIVTFKNEALIHQSYIPLTVFEASAAAVKQMQDDLKFWSQMGRLSFEGKYDSIDYEKGSDVVDELLNRLVAVELSIKKRLEELSNIS